MPSPFRDRDPRVKRLFDDVVAVEKEYFAATRIFPIMHVVVIRADVYERHRWVAQSLYKACLRARDLAYERIYDSSALRFMEPWLIQHLEESRDLLGRDYWSYGLAENENVLDVFLALPPRAGTVPQALRARRPVRTRGDGSVRHLSSHGCRTFLTARIFREISSGKERSREKTGASQEDTKHGRNHTNGLSVSPFTVPDL